MKHNLLSDDIGQMTIGQFLTRLRPAQLWALLSAQAVVLAVTFALGIWVQKHILTEKALVANKLPHETSQHTSAWRKAVLIRNEFTASDWSNDWKKFFLSDRLREEYINNIVFLKNLGLRELKPLINELEIRLNLLPRLTDSSPAPDKDYSRRFESFRASANKLVDTIDMSAAGAGLNLLEIRGAGRGD